MGSQYWNNGPSYEEREFIQIDYLADSKSHSLLIKKFNDTRINFKLAVAFFTIAFLSILVIGLLSYFSGKKSLEQESFNRLTAVREMKATQIEDYFLDITNQLITFSEDHTVVDAIKDFKNGYDSLAFQVNRSSGVLDSASERLKNYYESEYLPRLNNNVQISEDVMHHWPKDETAILLQDIFIYN